MRVVIVGLGEVGSYLAKILSMQEKHDVVCVDKDRKKLEALEELYDIRTVEGYGAAPHILRQAEADRADVFLAVSGNDEVNIVAALIVRTLGNAFTIARVSNPVYLEERQLEDYENLGVNLLVSPERRTALTLFQSIEYPHFLKVSTLADGKVHVDQYRISSNSPFVYKRIKEIELQELLIVGIMRRRNFLFASGDTLIHPNDTLFIAGKPEQMQLNNSILPVESKEIERILLFGASEISYFLARMLEKHYRVLIIEPDAEQSERIAQSLSNTVVYNDDIFSSTLLNDLLLNEHDYFIAAAESDESNLLSSLLIKEHGVSMVACIIHRSSVLSAVEKAGIHQVFSPQLIIANDIASAIRSRDLLALNDADNIEAEFVEFELQADSPASGQPIHRLTLPPSTLIVAILRGEDALIPKGDTVLRPNDKLIVLYLKANLKTITELFNPHAL